MMAWAWERGGGRGRDNSSYRWGGVPAGALTQAGKAGGHSRWGWTPGDGDGAGRSTSGVMCGQLQGGDVVDRQRQQRRQQ